MAYISSAALVASAYHANNKPHHKQANAVIVPDDDVVVFKEPDLNDLPPELQSLISDLIDAVTDITGELEMDLEYVVQWQNEMERLLTRYHTAAYMAGQNSAILAAEDLANIGRIVATQLAYLDNFATVIADSDTFQAGWNARAIMYALGIKEPYWAGKTRILPLPALPTQGTTCLTRCACLWDISPIDEEKGDYDCRWILGGTKEHCQICQQRALEWNPLRIRNLELVI